MGNVSVRKQSVWTVIYKSGNVRYESEGVDKKSGQHLQ